MPWLRRFCRTCWWRSTLLASNERFSGIAAKLPNDSRRRGCALNGRILFINCCGALIGAISRDVFDICGEHGEDKVMCASAKVSNHEVG